MSLPTLARIPLTPDLLARESVRQFDCGDEPWEKEITDWLHAPAGGGGASDDLANGSDIGLYLNDAGELVGVGAFAPSRVGWPKPNSDLIPAWCITMLGVDRHHQRKKYGHVILGDLLRRILDTGTDPIAVLYVRVGSPAINFYTSHNFKPHGKPRKAPEGHENQRMVLDLSAPPVTP